MDKTFISQKEAYDIYKSHGWNCSGAARQIIEVHSLSDDLFETIRWKLRNLRKSRDHYQKIYNLNVWEGMEFYSVTTCNSGSQMSIDTVDSIPEQHSFIEENLTEIRKPLFKLTMKAARNRLNVLLKHIQFVAQREQVDEKKVADLALELISNQEYDRETSSICKEIIATGTYGNVKKVSTPMSSYIIDLLEIGAFKYTQLKKLLKQDIVFPSYKVISQYSQEISLSRSVLFVTNPEGNSIGVSVPYFEILELTIQRHLLSFDSIVNNSQYPVSSKCRRSSWMRLTQFLQPSELKSRFRYTQYYSIRI
ncbi:hypothetical protein LOD99_9031 [Oopsacas minuta]|uniref:Uncharacterized protein n=1 Tax=Oopsacas minuta TaxID=111878 RepID=A0AAV7JDT9_9METZ|nr:hypothetical protein LOD99_9031 [Oopsacas minuta]